MLFGYGLREPLLQIVWGGIMTGLMGELLPVPLEGRHDKQGPMDEHSSVATAAPIVALTLLLVVGAIALGALRAHAHEIPHLS